MNVLQRLGERFWFLPALLCVGAALAAELLVWIDATWTLRLPGWVETIVYRVGESGSRDILGAIATSSLAVAGTTFSITMAVLALTSSSYGPRLVRNFMTDRGNQLVLGVYVATFLYSLLVLRSVRAVGDPGDPQAEVFVPHLAINFAVVLAVLDVAVLVYFIHHISDSIQVSSIAGRVRADLHATIERLYPDRVGKDEDEVDASRAQPAAPREGGEPVRAGRPGYVTWVRGEDLLSAAGDADVLVDVRVLPGQHVLEGGVVAVLHPAGRAGSETVDAVREAIRIEDARSPYQDVSFATQQLVELAVRALSPGTNDPFTALNALDDLASGLSLLATRSMPSAYRYDESGTCRVHAPHRDAVELTSDVFDQIRWYATESPAVMHGLLDLVQRVGRHAGPEGALRTMLLTQVALLQEAFQRAGHQGHDVERYDTRAAQVREVLRHR